MTDSTTSAADAPSSVLTGCVHCHAPLQLQPHESVHLLACPSGHGVFIHADALRAAVRDRTADRPEHEERTAEAAQRPHAVEELVATEGLRTCPTCGVEMAKQVFGYESGVPTDVCAEHGVWLDQGELQRIEAWYEAQERHKDADTREWGGADGRLEQIEAESERQRARDITAAHWGPVGWFLGKADYAWSRRDDLR